MTDNRVYRLWVFFCLPIIWPFMEFLKEALINREIEIATYLLNDFSLKKIAVELAVSKKIIAAHVRNMMQKLHAENMEDLVRFLKEKQQKK